MPEASLSWMAALAAGFVYFLSPCVWPLYPVFLSHLAGAAEPAAARRGVLWLRAVAFVLGFSLVFVVLGATASAIGRLLLAHQPILRRLAGLLIIAFGLMMLGWLKVPGLGSERRPLAWRPRPGLAGSLLMGIAFGVGWTPCVGPVLAGILALASLSATVGQGVLLLAAFAAGLAVPFLLLALLVERLQGRWSRYGRHLPLIGRLAGAFMVIFGLLVYTNYLTLVSAWLFYQF
ncbi:MAG TPA: cytochrome c biogenesis protein CcdA [Bacillota bacterium]